MDPVFSLLVRENDDLPEEMFGEASMGKVSCNVADWWWVGVLVVGGKHHGDLLVVAFVKALGDEVHDVIEMFDHVVCGCLVGEAIKVGAVFFSLVRFWVITGVSLFTR